VRPGFVRHHALRFQLQPFAANSKPSVRWNTTRLHAKGYISDPKSKAKSVVVTVKGMQRCSEPLEKHFEKKKPESRQL
jgi:hypothetical protein